MLQKWQPSPVPQSRMSKSRGQNDSEPPLDLLCRKYKPGMATVQQPLVWLQKTVYSSQAWLNFSIDTHVTNLLQRIFDVLDSWLLLLRATLWIHGCCPSQCIWVYAYGVMTDQIRVFLCYPVSKGFHFYKQVLSFSLKFLGVSFTNESQGLLWNS